MKSTKKSRLILALGMIVCAVCCYQMLTVTTTPGVEVPAIAEVPPKGTQPRESITFILGEDNDENNRYYEEASRYYARAPEGKTEYLVTSCRSLLEVRNYLEKNRPHNQLPWGLINLVSHGNQWTGLSVRVMPGAKRTTAVRLAEYIDNNTFKPLPQTIADEDTEIFLHGCGLGNNRLLINTIARAFGGTDHVPVVRASRLFEYYASVQRDNRVESQRYMADTWLVSYKMGEKPPAFALLKELHEKYPRARIDWGSALSRTQPRWVGDCYHYTFEVPVKWIIPVSEDSLPDLTNHQRQLEWIVSQKNITRELANLGIPSEKFSWSFTKVYLDRKDSTRTPAFWVKGYCTILAVLQALTDGSDEASALRKPFIPSLDDSTYYYSTTHYSNSLGLKPKAINKNAISTTRFCYGK
jgi:hypothetical protein